MSTDDEKTNLPATYDDGWDEADSDDRIIQGDFLKCVDGYWSSKTCAELPQQLLALETRTFLQRWLDDKKVKTIIGRSLPDPDRLNAEIPRGEWRNGLDGNPEPPWKKQYLVYLLDENTAAAFTFSNHTAGAKIAVNNLKDRVHRMRMLRGDNVVARVELSRAPMRTEFGQKLRPDFKVVAWHKLGDGGNVIEAGTPPKQLPPANAYAEAKGRTLKTVDPISNVITEVERPSVKEELDDEIPF